MVLLERTYPSSSQHSKSGLPVKLVFAPEVWEGSQSTRGAGGETGLGPRSSQMGVCRNVHCRWEGHLVRVQEEQLRLSDCFQFC